MINKFLKIAGVKDEASFYKKYPTEDSFYKKYPHASNLKIFALGGYNPIGDPLQPGNAPLSAFDVDMNLRRGLGNSPYSSVRNPNGDGLFKKPNTKITEEDDAAVRGTFEPEEETKAPEYQPEGTPNMEADKRDDARYERDPEFQKIYDESLLKKNEPGYAEWYAKKYPTPGGYKEKEKDPWAPIAINAINVGARSISEQYARNKQDQYTQNNIANPYANLAFNDGRSSNSKFGYAQYRYGGKFPKSIPHLKGGGNFDIMDFLYDDEDEDYDPNARINDDGKKVVKENTAPSTEEVENGSYFENKRQTAFGVLDAFNPGRTYSRNLFSGSRNAPKDIQNVIEEKAQQYGVPSELLTAQIQVESGFNPNANSGKAQGISQFTPATAAQYGVDVNDPVSSIDGQARLMRDLYKKTGNWKDALTAYHSGLGNLRKLGPQGKAYYGKIAKAAGQYFEVGGILEDDPKKKPRPPYVSKLPDWMKPKSTILVDNTRNVIPGAVVGKNIQKVDDAHKVHENMSKDYLKKYYTWAKDNLPFYKDLSSSDSAHVQNDYTDRHEADNQRLSREVDSLYSIFDNRVFTDKEHDLFQKKNDSLASTYGFSSNDIQDPNLKKKMEDELNVGYDLIRNSPVNNLDRPIQMKYYRDYVRNSDGLLGEFNPKSKTMSISEKSRLGTLIHEYSHLADRDRRLKGYDYNQNFIKEILGDKVNPSYDLDLNYLADFSERQARHRSTNFWLSQNMPNYDYKKPLSSKEYNYLISNKSKLPSDVGQLIDLYNGENNFIKHFNEFKLGGRVPKFEKGGGVKNPSVVDYLATMGYSGKKSFRKNLASQYGVEGYDFSAAKNTELLNKLRENQDLLKTNSTSFAPISYERLEQMRNSSEKAVESRNRLRSSQPISNTTNYGEMVSSNKYKVEDPIPNIPYNPMKYSLMGDSKKQMVYSNNFDHYRKTPVVAKPVIEVSKSTYDPNYDSFKYARKAGKPIAEAIELPKYDPNYNSFKYARKADAEKTIPYNPNTSSYNRGRFINEKPGVAVSRRPSDDQLQDELANDQYADIRKALQQIVKNVVTLGKNGIERTINKAQGDGIESKSNIDFTKPETLISPVITGDTLWDDPKKRVFHIPSTVDLTRVKLGSRGRDENSPIDDTFGMLFSGVDKEKMLNTSKDNLLPDQVYVGHDAEGNVKIGKGSDFKNTNYNVLPFSSDEVTGFKRDPKTGYKYGKSIYRYNYSPILNRIDGSDKVTGLQVNQDNLIGGASLYGNVQGGKMLFTSKDFKKQMFTSGSINDINKALEKFKKDNKLSSVLTIGVDNGSQGRTYNTKDHKLTSEDLYQFDHRDRAGGAGFYLKNGKYKYGGQFKAKNNTK